MQAERDEKKMADVERQAVLSAQAVALRRKLTESHLAKFRTESKNRCALQHPLFRALESSDLEIFFRIFGINLSAKALKGLALLVLLEGHA